MFNSLLNIYLRIFYSSFPPKRVINRNNDNNNWITLEIKTSCKHKGELYTVHISSNYLELKGHYQVYCKILKSSNKCKTARNIFKELSRKEHSKTDRPELKIEGKYLIHQQEIADAFNNYFSSIVDK
jgi:aconitase B